MLDDGREIATAEFGVKNGIGAYALGACIYDVKFTREYRFSRAIIFGRTSATVGLFLGCRSRIHGLFCDSRPALVLKNCISPKCYVDDGRSSATVDFGAKAQIQ